MGLLHFLTTFLGRLLNLETLRQARRVGFRGDGASAAMELTRSELGRTGNLLRLAQALLDAGLLQEMESRFSAASRHSNGRNVWANGESS